MKKLIIVFSVIAIKANAISFNNIRLNPNEGLPDINEVGVNVMDVGAGAILKEGSLGALRATVTGLIMSSVGVHEVVEKLMESKKKLGLVNKKFAESLSEVYQAGTFFKSNIVEAHRLQSKSIDSFINQFEDFYSAEAKFYKKLNEIENQVQGFNPTTFSDRDFKKSTINLLRYAEDNFVVGNFSEVELTMQFLRTLTIILK